MHLKVWRWPYCDLCNSRLNLVEHDAEQKRFRFLGTNDLHSTQVNFPVAGAKDSFSLIAHARVDLPDMEHTFPRSKQFVLPENRTLGSRIFLCHRNASKAVCSIHS